MIDRQTVEIGTRLVLSELDLEDDPLYLEVEKIRFRLRKAQFFLTTALHEFRQKKESNHVEG